MVLLAFDVDGTIADSSGRIPDPLLAVLRSVARAGHRLTVISGRSERSLAAVVAQLGVTLPYGTWHGARVATARRRVVRETRLAADLVTGLIDLAGDAVREVHAETNDRLYVRDARSPYWDWARRKGLGVDEVAAGVPEPVYKLTLHCPAGTAAPVAARLRRHHPRLTYFEVGDSFVDVTAEAADKGAALGAVAAAAGVTCADVVAFGDDRNDLPMFRRAGHRVAVGTRDPLVRAAADEYVAGPGSAALADLLRRRYGPGS